MGRDRLWVLCRHRSKDCSMAHSFSFPGIPPLPPLGLAGLFQRKISPTAQAGATLPELHYRSITGATLHYDFGVSFVKQSTEVSLVRRLPEKRLLHLLVLLLLQKIWPWTLPPINVCQHMGFMTKLFQMSFVSECLRFITMCDRIYTDCAQITKHFSLVLMPSKKVNLIFVFEIITWWFLE